MKRVLLLLVAIGLWFSAFTPVPDAIKAAFATEPQSEGRARDTDPPRERYISPGVRHKLMVKAQDSATYADLLSRNAILEEFDYGSFKMVIVNEEALGGRDALKRLAAVSDEQNLILLNAYALDTTNPEATWQQLPDDLRASKSPDTLAQGVSAAGALYLVQFAGPIQDAWLDSLKSSGVEIVSYIPNNAYVVRVAGSRVKRLTDMKRGNPFLQFIGNYEPAFRLSPLLEQIRRGGSEESVSITVQVIDGSDAEQTISYLKTIASDFVGSHRVMNYHNVEMRVSPARLGEIASLETVFAVEERGERRRQDEAQGQIVAGNLSGNAPSGPGYLSWLSSKGFNSSQFTSFAVNVADDAYSLTGHPDLPNARVAFENNPTGQIDDPADPNFVPKGGHGFLNAHIVGGYNNNQFGSEYQDANGYNYGLGIAPWARVGVTAIFGTNPTLTNPSAMLTTGWESTAYDQGSRISSNSWGWTTNNRTMPVPRYDASAQLYDTIVRDVQSGTAGLQQLTIVFSAGNFGSGANTVSSPATAKNIITVGAGENVRQTGTDGCTTTDTGADSANDIIGFSSRGPVNAAGNDGRVKPDIMAPGTHIQAGIPQSDYDGSTVCNQYWPVGQTLYGWSSGTSHACPAVAGGAALVYQDFLNKGRAAPSPAMVKAYLMNSATYMTGVGANDTLPSNSQGMGRMDMGRAFDFMPRLLVDQTQTLGASGQTYQVTGSVVNTNQPLRVTLAWTDAPGPVVGAPFINNLDLEVTVGGTTYKGNVFTGANSTTGGSADTRNNVESIFIPAGVSGCVTITVRATNIAGDGVPGNADVTDQDFALVVYNAEAITATPQSLVFTTIAGCSNPPSQTINLTNACGGTWTAISNQPWLSVTPGSGSVPSTATVSVNIAGLAAGTYNGAITVTASGANGLPISIPVTLTLGPRLNGGQLIINNSFEGGILPWFLTGITAHRLTNGGHIGPSYVSLGNSNFANDTAFQTIKVPCNAMTANLSFWLNVTSNETTTTIPFDRLFVEVRSTSGALLGTLTTFSNLNKVAASNLYTLRGNYSLLAYKGQTVRLQFRVATDSMLATTFRIDDVSVQWAQ